jgi:hypothetical protein
MLGVWFAIENRESTSDQSKQDFLSSSRFFTIKMKDIPSHRNESMYVTASIDKTFENSVVFDGSREVNRADTFLMVYEQGQWILRAHDERRSNLNGQEGCIDRVKK